MGFHKNAAILSQELDNPRKFLKQKVPVVRNSASMQGIVDFERFKIGVQISTKSVANLWRHAERFARSHPHPALILN